MVPRLTLNEQQVVQHTAYNRGLVFSYDHGRTALLIDKKVTPKKVYFINRSENTNEISATCPYTGEGISFSRTEKVDKKIVNIAHKRVRAREVERTLNNLFDVVMTPESDIKGMDKLKKLGVKMAFLEASQILKVEPTKQCMVILTRTKRHSKPCASVRFINSINVVEERDIEVPSFIADQYR